MKRWWKRGVAMLAALLLLGALAVGGAAWRLSRLDAADASVLAARWGAEFEPMWPALWRQPGAGPDRAPVPPAAGLRWAGTPGWRLLPRPQLRLNDVRWPVDTRLATEGELRIQQLTLALEWTSLWAGEPRLHHALAHGIPGPCIRNHRQPLAETERADEIRLRPVGRVHDADIAKRQAGTGLACFRIDPGAVQHGIENGIA